MLKVFLFWNNNSLLYSFSCCGAGTAADTEYVTQLISSNIQLHSLSTGRQVWLDCRGAWKHFLEALGLN